MHFHLLVFQHNHSAIERLDNLDVAARELFVTPAHFLQLALRPLQFVLFALQHHNLFPRLLQIGVQFFTRNWWRLVKAGLRRIIL